MFTWATPFPRREELGIVSRFRRRTKAEERPGERLPSAAASRSGAERRRPFIGARERLPSAAAQKRGAPPLRVKGSGGG